MLEFALVIVLTLANGFFAMSEMAVMTSRKGRLKQLAKDSRGARMALELAEHPEGFLSSVQVSITLLGLLLGYFGAEVFAVYFRTPLLEAGLDAKWAEWIAKAIAFSLIFGGVVLARMRALLADVQAEARLRRMAEGF